MSKDSPNAAAERVPRNDDLDLIKVLAPHIGVAGPDKLVPKVINRFTHRFLQRNKRRSASKVFDSDVRITFECVVRVYVGSHELFEESSVHMRFPIFERYPCTDPLRYGRIVNTKSMKKHTRQTNGKIVRSETRAANAAHLIDSKRRANCSKLLHRLSYIQRHGPKLTVNPAIFPVLCSSKRYNNSVFVFRNSHLCVEICDIFHCVYEFETASDNV